MDGWVGEEAGGSKSIAGGWMVGMGIGGLGGVRLGLGMCMCVCVLYIS